MKLHGITAGSLEANVASGKECGFFIVVDRLHSTLEKRLADWRMAKEEHSFEGGFLFRIPHETKEKRRAELSERIRLAFSIASAMEYLHELDVVFRDLKPDNIGFDREGVLKLFDFGLAKELKEKDKTVDDQGYNLTGNSGSRRYMAPEVAKEKPYGKPVDVYSFGIMLWELCSTEKPFQGYSSNKHMQKVILGGERPKMDSHHTSFWPAQLQVLIKGCWSEDPMQRPSFSEIKATLSAVLQLMATCGLDKPGSPKHRRSLFSRQDSDSFPDSSQKSIGSPFRVKLGISRPQKQGRHKTWPVPLLR